MGWAKSLVWQPSDQGVPSKSFQILGQAALRPRIPFQILPNPWSDSPQTKDFLPKPSRSLVWAAAGGGGVTAHRTRQDHETAPARPSTRTPSNIYREVLFVPSLQSSQTLVMKPFTTFSSVRIPPRWLLGPRQGTPNEAQKAQAKKVLLLLLLPVSPHSESRFCAVDQGATGEG